jgi:proteasome accessory factor B
METISSSLVMPKVTRSRHSGSKARRKSRFASPLRPALERIMAIHSKVAAGSYPNCRQLSSDMEVSEKTLARDIVFMRDRLGLPLEYNRIQHGFAYTEPVKEFPALQITEGEVVALLFAQKSLAQYRGTPFEKPLQSAVNKLMAALPDGFSLGWDALTSGLEFRPTPVSPSDLEIFQILAEAVRHRQEVGLTYHKLLEDSPVERTVHPRQLCCAEGQWYLVAHDTSRTALRNFALPRIKKARITGNSFDHDPNFDSREYWANSFGAFVGTGKWEVKLRFDRFAARLVQERLWHPSQKIIPRAHGAIDVTLHLSSLHEVRRWVLSWGEHVTVLGPPELRDQMRTLADTLTKRYQTKPKKQSGKIAQLRRAATPSKGRQ